MYWGKRFQKGGRDLGHVSEISFVRRFPPHLRSGRYGTHWKVFEMAIDICRLIDYLDGVTLNKSRSWDTAVELGLALGREESQLSGQPLERSKGSIQKSEVLRMP